jgi:hypothetical protein
MIIFVGLAFCGGIPLILPVCAVALGLRYFFFKYMFLRFCQVPKNLDEAINERILNYLPWALIIHYAFSIWMYGSISIFSVQESYVTEYVNFILMQLANHSDDFLSLFSAPITRILNSSYFSIALAVTLLVIIVKSIVYDLIIEPMEEARNEDRVPTAILRAEELNEDDDPTNDVKLRTEK